MKILVVLSLSACFYLCSSFRTTSTHPIHACSKKYTKFQTFRLTGVKKSTAQNESTVKGFTGSAKTSPSPASKVEKVTKPANPSFQDELDLSKCRCSSAVEDYCPQFNMNFPGIRRIHVDPPIFEVDNFFSADLCEHMIQRASNKGIQVASQTFSPLTSTKRTSTTWYLPYSDVPEFLIKANKLTGFPIINFEEPQIVRYEMGQQFSWHYDSIPKSILDNSGQRIATLLVYLKQLTKVALLHLMILI